MLTPSAVSASVAYLLVYVLGSLAVFGVTAAVHPRAEGAGGRSLAAYLGLARRSPLLAVVLGLGLLTLAGLPPAVVGVVAKIAAIGPVVATGQWWLVAVLVVNIVLGIAVYLRWLLYAVRPAPAGAPTTREERLDPGLLIALLLVSAALILLSLLPGLGLGLAR